MKMYVWECRVCLDKDIAERGVANYSSCQIASSEEDIFDLSTKCPIDGEDDAVFKLIGTSRGVNRY